MSENQPKQSPKSGLAIGYLALSFAAGLLFVYSVGAYIPNDETAESPAPSTPKAAETAPATDAAVSPTAEPAPEAELARAQEQLEQEMATTRQRMDRLEESLVSLERDQAAAFENAHRRLAAELADLVRASRPATEEGPEAQEESAPAASLEEELAMLEPRQTPDGLRISLAESELRFAPGSADLPDGRPATLAKVAELLSERPDVRILLRGHTDSQGSATGNLELSERRALAVKTLLAASGIEETRIRAEGLGEGVPIATNETEEGRARNRRVDIYLTQP
ncbi:OmpA family protein [Imhoffiella purpurea]|uniref:OmpA/MotB n=1 Tax=Imhoffiella purpurea TaxID=1249627 RepID=W9V4W4_9GAMM|nr:OmpA family protein [Imhoffiella purpurea]EXJ14588.1 OmpA/MotB [Imhoffiella purpurea]